MQVLKPADFFLVGSLLFTPFLISGCEQSIKQKIILMPFPVLSEREGERQLFFIGSLQSGGGLFKKEGVAFFFGKFAPRREREAESQGQKRGGALPSWQAARRNLGKPLFCLFYPLLSKISPLRGCRGNLPLIEIGSFFSGYISDGTDGNIKDFSDLSDFEFVFLKLFDKEALSIFFESLFLSVIPCIKES